MEREMERRSSGTTRLRGGAPARLIQGDSSYDAMSPTPRPQQPLESLLAKPLDPKSHSGENLESDGQNEAISVAEIESKLEPRQERIFIFAIIQTSSNDITLDTSMLVNE